MPLLPYLSDLPFASLLSALIFLTLCLHRVYLWHRLRHIPGPMLASWSVGWQLTGALSGRYHKWLKDAVDKHGKSCRHDLHLASSPADEEYKYPGLLIRIGPNELLSTDPEVLRRMSAVRSAYTKGPFYDAARFVPDVDNVVSMRDEGKHKALRAKMTPAVRHLPCLLTPCHRS